MLNESEEQAQKSITDILSRIEDGEFGCRERKTTKGGSSIDKPADLEVYFIDDSDRVAVAVEIANVNTTQLVGEVTRLYCDCCPAKLLILFRDNATKGVKKQCEKLFWLLYGQEDIRHTPARVEWYNEEDQIENSLKELLQR